MRTPGGKSKAVKRAAKASLWKTRSKNAKQRLKGRPKGTKNVTTTERLPRGIGPMECQHQTNYTTRLMKTKGKRRSTYYPQICEPKINGIRGFAYLREPRATVFSRNGKPFFALRELEAELYELIDPKNPFFLDGELVDENFDSTLTMSRLFSYDHKKIKKKFTNKGHKMIFYVFDLVYRKEFEYPVIMPTLALRKRRLADWFHKHKLYLKNIKLLPYIEVESDEKLSALHSKFLEAGFEGTCVKNPHSRYIPYGRLIDWRKLKKAETCDLVVTGMDKGSRQSNLRDWAISSISCEGYVPHLDKHIKTNVYLGIPDYLRAQWREHPEEIIGKVVEIGYRQVTRKNLLRWAYFVRERPDKEPEPIKDANKIVNMDRMT